MSIFGLRSHGPVQQLEPLGAGSLGVGRSSSSSRGWGSSEGSAALPACCVVSSPPPSLLYKNHKLHSNRICPLFTESDTNCCFQRAHCSRTWLLHPVIPHFTQTMWPLLPAFCSIVDQNKVLSLIGRHAWGVITGVTLGALLSFHLLTNLPAVRPSFVF